MYFTTFSRNFIASVLLIIVMIPITAFMVSDVLIAINISVFFQFSIIMIFISLVYSNRIEIRVILKYSYGLMMLLMLFLIGYVLVFIYVLTSVPDYSYGLYMSTESTAIMAYYTTVLAVTLLGLLVFLHLEQGIFLKKQNILTDDYSHRIGNILQIIVGASTTIQAFSDSTEIKSSTDLILERSEEAGELIKKIREM